MPSGPDLRLAKPVPYPRKKITIAVPRGKGQRKRRISAGQGLILKRTGNDFFGNGILLVMKKNNQITF